MRYFAASQRETPALCRTLGGVCRTLRKETDTETDTTGYGFELTHQDTLPARVHGLRWRILPARPAVWVCVRVGVGRPVPLVWGSLRPLRYAPRFPPPRVRGGRRRDCHYPAHRRRDRHFRDVSVRGTVAITGDARADHAMPPGTDRLSDRGQHVTTVNQCDHSVTAGRRIPIDVPRRLTAGGLLWYSRCRPERG